jgi:hypothetical protein
MAAADRLVERAAGSLEGLGLAGDAGFLRRLKPSLVLARARERTSKGAKGGGSGPNPLVVVGAAFVIGIALARLVDSRGHGGNGED